MKKRLLALVIGVAFITGFSLPVLARAQDDSVSNDTSLSDEQKQEIQEKIAEIKARRDAKKLELQQQACEKKEEILNKRIDHITERVKKHKEVFDKIYTRVQEFQDSGQLSADDYDTLKAAADAKKTEAETAIEALESFEFDVDCSSPNAGEQLSGFREAVNETRDALKAYKKAIVDIINSLNNSDGNSEEPEAE